MKPKMSRPALLLSLAVAAVLIASVYAQNTPATQGRGPTAGQGMMAQQQQMMAEMQAEQKKLGELVASMNNAKGPEKIDRIAAVVTEMVADHGRMSEHMMSMHSGMMQQMMQGRGAPPSGAGKADDVRPEGHDQHHP